jgi:phosphoesterase RecJ-like protein
MVPKNLCDALRKKENKVFLVFSHIHQEGDALGSQLALVRLIRALGKTAIAINEDRPPAEYSFLPGVSSIRHPQTLPAYDVAVFVDCSDTSRIGKLARLVRRDRLILNIDHHVSNTRFGDVNWINPGASSASEMVYEIFGALKIPLLKTDAALLYTGIFIDTGSFKYRTTSSRTHEVAAALLRHGLDAYGIYQKLYEDREFDSVKVTGKVLNTMRIEKTGRVAWLEVNAALLQQDPTLAERTDDLVGFARAVKGVCVALLFKEVKKGKEVRVNLRARGRVDVNKIAQMFGGGGHKMASGCTWHGTLKEAVARIVGAAVERCR